MNNERENVTPNLMIADENLNTISVIGSALNHASDEIMEETGGDGDNSKNMAGKGSSSRRRKVKRYRRNLAKHKLAERLRRRKLNAKLFKLRSVVPNMTKMDMPSILTHAIAYIKELTQKVNDLKIELESTPSNATLEPFAASSAASNFPSYNKEVIEVKQREDGCVCIHMSCSKKPAGLMHSIRTLDNLGLEIKQAIGTSFNGFTLDVFRAEKNNENVNPDQIKAKLMELVGYNVTG